MQMTSWVLVAALWLLGQGRDVEAEILGFPPPAGTCLCSTGDRLAARDGPCIKGCKTLLRLYKGDCFRFRGSVRTADGYDWFQLTNVDGLNLWTSGKYLIIGQDSQCSRSCSASAQTAACSVLNRHLLGEITLSVSHAEAASDGASAYKNIADMCSGKRANRSRFRCGKYNAPGGNICLDWRVLMYVLRLDRGNQVMELAGGCNKDAVSPSYLGRGVKLAKTAMKTKNKEVCEESGGTMTDDGNFLFCHFPREL